MSQSKVPCGSKFSSIRRLSTAATLFVCSLAALQAAAAADLEPPSEGAPPGVGAALKPLSLEGTANYGDLLNLNVSPDGKWVAATRGRFDDSAVQRTIVGLKTIVRDPLSGVEQHIRPPARSPGDIGPGRWSPDGRYFAYELVRGGRVVVAVWDSRTKASTEPGKLLLRPDEPEFPAYNPVWSPDSHFVLAREWARSTPIDNRTALPRALASYDFNFPKGPAPSVVTFRSSPGETDNATAVTTFLPANSYVHLTLLDVKTGGKVRLSDEAFVAGASFSPEGRYVEYATYEKFDGATSAQLFDIHLFDMAHRTSVVVAHDVRLGNPDVSWSPDGRKFAYVARTVYGGSHPGGDREDGVIVVTDVPDGATHKFLAPQGSFRRRGGLQAAPVWLRSGTICDVSDRGEVWKIDLDSGQATRIGVPNGYTVRSLLAPPKTGASEGVLILAVDAARHRSGIFQDRGQPEAAFVSGSKGLLWDAVAGGAGDRAIVAFEHQAADDPGTVLALDLSDNSVKPVEENGRALGDLRFGPVQVLSWTGADQQTHKAALMLPPDFRQGRRVPLVVWDYPTPHNADKADAYGFWGTGNFDMQVLATRGYAVLYPDIDVKEGTIMHDIAAQTEDAVQQAIDRGIADPDRLAIMGNSFGSYAVLSVITQSTRFRAAIPSAIVAPDVTSRYLNLSRGGRSDTTFFQQGGGMFLGGTLWQHPQRYIDNAPIWKFDRIQTPVLLGAGSNDSTTQYDGPTEVFAALQQLHKEAELRIYNHEGHSFEQPADVVDWWQRRIDFLDEKLDVIRGADGMMVMDGQRAASRQMTPKN